MKCPHGIGPTYKCDLCAPCKACGGSGERMDVGIAVPCIVCQSADEEEIERRLAADLTEAGEDPDADSDRAMYLRQDITNEVRSERRERITRYFKEHPEVETTITSWRMRGSLADFTSRVKLAPREESLRRAAWVLARCLEQGDQISSVVWLAAQLETVENGWRAAAVKNNKETK